MFAKIKNKKIVLGILFIAVFLPLSLVFAAEEMRTTALDTISTAGFTGYILMFLGGNIMVFTAGLVDFAVNLGNAVLTLSAVQEGWKIILLFTNFGFVLGVIIIAFATIFHLESYALKQILWKLIVAALLVNFSLVFCGAFISVSKIASDYFYNASIGNKENLSNALANAMNPQSLTAVKDKTTTLAKILEYFKSYVPGTEANLRQLVNIVFIVIFTFLTVLAFLTLFVMLLVRAFALIFLVILSPIVWLLWIFPNTKKYWTQWWQEFIRWNFFAPAVYFFIYLSLATANQIQKKAPELKGWEYIVGADTAKNAAQVFNTGSWINNIFTHAANQFVILGLLYGGIYVANKFGIAGGNIGVSLAQKIGKGVGVWAGRQGIRAGTGVFRMKPIRELGEKMQRLGAGGGKLGRLLATPVNKLGNAMGTVGVRQGEALIRKAEEEQKKYSDVELGRRVHQMNAWERQAALQRMAKNDTLAMVSGGVTQYITDSEKNTWARYGQGKQFGDLENSFGADTKTIAHLKSGELDKAAEALNKWTSNRSIKDYDKMSANILSNYDEKKNNLGLDMMQHAALNLIKTEAMVSQHPGTIPKIRPKLKGESLTQFNSYVEKFVDKIDKQLSDELGGADVNIDVGRKDKRGKPIFVSWSDAKNYEKVSYVSKNDKLLNTLTQLLKIEKTEKGAMEKAVNVLNGLYGAKKNFGGSLYGGEWYWGQGSSGGEKEEKT
jgi:hypothetical protein